MAQPYTKYHPDPSKPITLEHKKFLQQWDLWGKAMRRGVRVASETDEASQGSAQGSQGTDDGTPAPTDAETLVSSEEDDEPYEDWDVAELRDELEGRKLKKSGTKDELVKRLEEDDAKRQ